MSMLQASDKMKKTLVIAMAVAGGGVMLYYGYTKLKPKSKKSPGPPTTRKRPSSYKGAESDLPQESGSGDTASQTCAPSTERAEESIIEESSRPTCEIKPRDKVKGDTDPGPEMAAVASSLTESSFERVYLTTQAQQQGDEPASPQPESLAESFEKISLSQVESDLHRQKLESADTQQLPEESAHPQQSQVESAETVQPPPVESVGTAQSSLLESADSKQTAVESADTAQQLVEAAGTVQQSLLESADSVQQALLESADLVQQSLLESADTAQQLLQSSAYEKLSLSECQSVGESTSDVDKRSDNESSGQRLSETTQVGQAQRPAVSSAPLAQDVHSSLGDHQKSILPQPLVTVSAVGDGSVSVTDDNDIIVFDRPGQQEQKAPEECSGDHHSISTPLPPLVTVSAVGDGSLSVTDDNDIIVFGRPEQQEQKAPEECSGEEITFKEPPSESATAKGETGFEEREQCSGDGHCGPGEEYGPLAGGEEEELASEAEPEEVSSLVFVPHPTDRETFVDFGMHVTTTRSVEMQRQHMIVEVMPGGMAEQVGLNGGETLHRLNGMLVSRWSNEILQQQFRVIIPAAFQLTSIKPVQSKNGDRAMRMTKVSAAIYEDDSFVQVQVFSSTDRVTLDETEPGVCVDCSSRDSQLCFVEHRSSQTALTMHDCSVTVDTPQTDDSKFDLTQIVFDLVDQPGHRCCVFVKETADQDVVNSIVVTDRNHVAVTTMTSPATNVITTTDPRFFFIHAVDEAFCFESTELLDHYLAVRGGDVLVKFVTNVEERNMDTEVLFQVRRQETLQSS